MRVYLYDIAAYMTLPGKLKCTSYTLNEQWNNYIAEYRLPTTMRR